MGEVNYGIFNPMFGPETHYLKLLNLRINSDGKPTEELNKSLTCLNNILANNSTLEINSGLVMLFSDMNWRPNLVGCYVLFYLHPNLDSKVTSLLENRIKSGSWIGPQLLITYSMICNKTDNLIKEIPNIDERQMAKEKGAINYLLNAEIDTPKPDFKSQEFRENYSKYSIIEQVISGQKIAKGWKNSIEQLIKLGAIKYY